jgi:transaldolase/glucose-6-phosphate isomerase
VAFDGTVERRLEELERTRAVARIWAKDPTVWSEDPDTPEIRDRLGWLTVPDRMAAEAGTLAAFADDVRAHFSRVVLCGMGGSSLAPEVLRRTFGAAPGYPSLTVLDSTDPRAIAAAVPDRDLAQTLFLISSKSGTTLEPDCLFRHFWSRSGARGSQFVAITDPDTPLAELASERGFRQRFLNPPDIGGRYSVLSYFGLVPAALLGIDIARLLERARRMAQASAATVPAPDNPAARLGAALGGAALEGRDKVTFVLSAGVASFGLWVEQLIAESTGKQGKGIVPVADEPLGAPAVYGRDRLFVSMALAGEEDPMTEAHLALLADAGHPIVRIALADRYDLGGAFFQWELATAVACGVLGINAFDQPNVAESKANTSAVLERRARSSPAATRADLDRFFAGVKAGDYVALMVYLPPTPEYDRRLATLRVRLRDRLRVATTAGYGPRFLHSTGQLHKGGPAAGHFLQITERASQDIAIPGKQFTFGHLEAAQAEGDLRALRKLGRPALRLKGWDLLATALEA